jgi:hypothetical protein
MSIARRLPPVLLSASALCLSSLAVFALARLETVPPRTENLLVPEVLHEAGARTLPRVGSATQPSNAQAASVAPQAPGVSGTPAQTADVVLPDFTGKRLSLARREAKKLGLKLIARDAYGERIPADMGPYYRVHKQLSAQGTELAPGSSVEVRVRPSGGWAEGY